MPILGRLRIDVDDVGAEDKREDEDGEGEGDEEGEGEGEGEGEERGKKLVIGVSTAIWILNFSFTYFLLQWKANVCELFMRNFIRASLSH